MIKRLIPLSYEGMYPSLMKKFVHPYWRLLMLMFIMCMTENRGGTYQLNITQSAAFICLITNQPFNYSKYVFEGMKRNVTGVQKDKFIMYPRFLQMIFNARYSDLERTGNTLDLKPMGPTCFEEVAVEPVIVQPEPVNAALVNIPVNVIIVEEHVVQATAEERPEVEILTTNSDDEGMEISCDDNDEVELPPEAEVSPAVSTFQLVISAESLDLLIKSVTKKMVNPPSDPSVQSEDQMTEDQKDLDTQQVKRRRRDPRPGVYIEKNKDQPTTAAEDEDGLYDFDFEKDTTATAVDTETWFDFDVDTTRIDVDVNLTEILPVTAAIESSSSTVRDEPCSSSGKRPEEPLTMPYVDDSSNDDEFISMREMKKRIVVLVQDSIHKDAMIIQLKDTMVQKNQLQGGVSLLFNMVCDLCGKLVKKFGDAFSDPADMDSRRKAKEDEARAFAKDDAERAASMDHYFKKVTEKDADKAKAATMKKKREYVILKNKNLNPADEDVQVTHHLMDIGENFYDKVIVQAL
ncbi:hypothetical protein Hanom_Chr03g00213021 [Helianthus anomalus]